MGGLHKHTTRLEGGVTFAGHETHMALQKTK